MMPQLMASQTQVAGPNGQGDITRVAGPNGQAVAAGGDIPQMLQQMLGQQ